MKGPLSADVHWMYGNQRRQSEVSLKSGVTALFGPSGAGKTTLGRTLAGLSPALPESVITLGHEVLNKAGQPGVAAHLRRIVYMAQDALLFPHLHVRGNITYGCRPKWTASLEDLCERLGIDGLLERKANQISGGEARRVSLARALAAGPEMLILDEPFAGLDVRARDRVAREIKLAAEAGTVILLMSHDVDPLMALADSGYLISNGHLIASGPFAPLLDSEETLQVFGRRLGATLVTVKVTSHGTGLLGPHPVWFEAPVAAGAHVQLQVRSQDVALAKEKVADISIRNQWPAVITDISAAGHDQRVMLRVAETDVHFSSLITVHALESLGLSVGDQVFALVKAASLAPS